MDGRGMGERSPFYLKDRIAMDFLHLQRGNISENWISWYFPTESWCSAKEKVVFPPGHSSCP